MSTRQRRTAALALVVLVLLVCATLSLASRTEPECADLGFDKAVVRCTHCDTLFAATQSSELKEECLDCCTADVAEDGVAEGAAQYASARIEGRGIRRIIEAGGAHLLAVFSRNYKDEPYFEEVSFVEKAAVALPQVVLVDDEGKDAVTTRIAGWSPETIHDYLKKMIRVE